MGERKCAVIFIPPCFKEMEEQLLHFAGAYSDLTEDVTDSEAD